MEPICLFDGMHPVKSIMTQNQVGKFGLLVCCGNVRQVQHLLNKSLLNSSRSSSVKDVTDSSNTSSRVSSKPIEVEYDKKLGVFIKDRNSKQHQH